MNKHPTGKGYLIWSLAHTVLGNPQRAAEMARAARLNWVAIKIHDGTAWYNGSAPAVRAWVDAFLGAGVSVWAWGYNYASDPRAEAFIAIERMHLIGPFAGCIINAEHQYKAQPDAARRWVAAFREREPEMALGLCSYRYPSLHGTFPWREFLERCDFHMPQVYWMGDGRAVAPAQQLARSLAELRAIRDLPVVPLGVSSPDDRDTWRPTLEQIRNFDQAAHSESLPGVGWWSWQHSERVDPRWWAEIASHVWPVAGTGAPAAITAHGKVGPQLNIQGDADATAWLVNGEPSAGLGINIGPPGEVTGTEHSAKLFWVGRNYEDAWNPTDPARDGYSGDPVLDARRYASIWFSPWLPLNPWARLVAAPNEPIVHTLAEMDYTARFLAELVRILREEFGRTAVIGNWSVTHPRVELWEAYRPALRAAAQYGAVLGRHSYGPLTEDFALRHRRDNAYFTRLGYPDLPVLITECGWENIPGVDRAWGTDPRRPPEAYADYLMALNDELMRDPYVLGASVFVHGVNWAGHNLNGSGVGRLMGERLGARPRFTLPWPIPRPLPPEGDDEMSAETRAAVLAELAKIEAAQAESDAQAVKIEAAQAVQEEQMVAITTAAQAIAALVQAEPEPEWWETQPLPFVAVARALPLTTYKAPAGDIFDVRPGASYDLNVTDRAVAGSEGWLKVAPLPLWVRAADVKLKGS